MFVHENLSFTTTDLSEFCKDLDIEICAVKLHFSFNNFCIWSVYRSPPGNFTHFLSSLGTILNRLYKNALNIIVCGDFNPLNTKRRRLYLKTQFVPRSKHFSSRL